MIRIVPPKCSVCGGHAAFESQLWPTLRVCYDCLLTSATYLMHDHRSVLDHNPLAEELFSGVFKGGPEPDESQYNIWFRTQRNEIGSTSQALIQRVAKKSENSS